MLDLSVYRIRKFSEDEFERLQLSEDLAAGINLEATPLMWRLQTKAAELLLKTRRPQAQILPHYYFFSIKSVFKILHNFVQLYALTSYRPTSPPKQRVFLSSSDSPALQN